MIAPEWMEGTLGRLDVAERQEPVPFADLRGQAARLRDELVRAVTDVVESGGYILGPHVQAFERAFAAEVGTRHCVAVNSGTSAIHLALLAAGVGPGDEVIVPAMTFVATCWPVTYLGARPVFVDVDPVTYTLDPQQVARAITRRTRALLPVHLYGQPAELAALRELGERYEVQVIEDAAQAHGASYHGRPAGAGSLCGCFSFYPSKNLGACGEGGAVVTDHDEVAGALRALRDQGQRVKGRHDGVGFNYRMEALQGAVLGVKLPYLAEWIAARRLLAARYRELLADLPVQLPQELPDREHAWHLFVLLHPERDRLRTELEEQGIQTGLHYPVPVHLQPAYRHLGHRPGDFPVSERIARECLSLPLYPELTLRQQDRVVEALREALAGR